MGFFRIEKCEGTSQNLWKMNLKDVYVGSKIFEIYKLLDTTHFSTTFGDPLILCVKCSFWSNINNHHNFNVQKLPEFYYYY